jgi:hypothetical protein
VSSSIIASDCGGHAGLVLEVDDICVGVEVDGVERVEVEELK